MWKSQQTPVTHPGVLTFGTQTKAGLVAATKWPRLLSPAASFIKLVCSQNGDDVADHVNVRVLPGAYMQQVWIAGSKVR